MIFAQSIPATRVRSLLLGAAESARGAWTHPEATRALLAQAYEGAAHDLICGCEDSTISHLADWVAAETSWRPDAGTAAEAALRAALEADATAAEVRRLEVEALQAAARKHREDAARLRDTVTQAVTDLDREDVDPRYVRDGLLRALGETRTED